VAAVAVLAMMIGSALGGFGILDAQKKKEDKLYVLDKNGKSVHLGDVIKVDKFSAPIKVRGWVSVDKAGTTSGYEYQIELCPSCKWVETFPPKRAAFEERGDGSRSVLVRFLELYAPATVHAQDDNGDGRSIIWGS
jgi:hypothetical protein